MARPVPEPLDASTHLAVLRTRLALERTMMGWIRTSTSLIAFGTSAPVTRRHGSVHASSGTSASRVVTPGTASCTTYTSAISAVKA